MSGFSNVPAVVESWRRSKPKYQPIERVQRPEEAFPIFGRNYVSANRPWMHNHFLKDWPCLMPIPSHMKNRLRAMGFPDATAWISSTGFVSGDTGTGWIVQWDGLLINKELGNFDHVL